jgi:uncharacterized protein (TIGR02217 family)
MPVNFPSIKSRYGCVRIPMFDTTIVRYGSRVEQRLANLASPYHKFVVQVKIRSVAIADTILEFFIARKGSYEAFYFQNSEEAYGNRAWLAATVYAAGAIVCPTSQNGRSYKCTTAGTSHGSTQPTWPTTYHGTVNDNGLIWTENSYTVRFEEDVINLEGVYRTVYDLGEITLIEVPA